MSLDEPLKKYRNRLKNDIFRCLDSWNEINIYIMQNISHDVESEIYLDASRNLQAIRRQREISGAAEDDVG